MTERQSRILGANGLLLIMRLIRNAIFFAVFFLSPLLVYADVFQYFDQDGTLIITDRPPGLGRPGPGHVVGTKNIKLEYREDVYYDYYPVKGGNFQEVVHSVSINSPFDKKENKSYPAQTRWNLGWSYKFDCSYQIEDSFIHVFLNIYAVDFRSDITVVLPMISGDTELNSHDLKLWEDFMQRLLSHEHDHVRITKDPLYQDEALNEISKLKELIFLYEPHSDIDSVIRKAVEAETGKIGHDFIKAIKARNDEYDRLTEHGLKPEMRDVFFGM